MGFSGRDKVVSAEVPFQPPPPHSDQSFMLSFKLVLLGESSVGKSSLVLRFVKDQFDDFRESTIGGELHFKLESQSSQPQGFKN